MLLSIESKINRFKYYVILSIRTFIAILKSKIVFVAESPLKFQATHFG